MAPAVLPRKQQRPLEAHSLRSSSTSASSGSDGEGEAAPVPPTSRSTPAAWGLACAGQHLRACGELGGDAGACRGPWQPGGARFALTVRNTFIEVPLRRSASLERLLPLRRASSAPGSAQGPRWQRPLPEVPAGQRSAAPGAGQIAGAAGGGAGGGLPLAPPCPVLRLAAVLGPEAGEAPAAQRPSSGSLSHHLGQCRPCAFVWKGSGCGNGAECAFCHLCDRGEKQRRQKEKRAYFRATRATGP